MKSIIITAKNIEQAIEQGLAELNTEFENVDINVLSEGGLFKKAKIEMKLSSEYIKENFKVGGQKQQTVKSETEHKNSKRPKNNGKTTEKQAKTSKNTVKTQNTSQKSTNDSNSKTRKSKKENTNKHTQNLKEEDFSKELKKIESELKEFEKPEKSNKQQEIEKVDELVKEFLNGLIYSFNIIATVETEYSNGVLNTRIVGENLGFLIGNRGESLDAIQYLTNNLVINKLRSRIRVILDIENYRKKRENNLKSMATKMADRVLENKKSLKLQPMSSYERKIIHTHLQKIKNIETYSEGKDPRRHLVIKFKD